MIKQPRTHGAIERQAQLEQSLLELMQNTHYSRITVTDICRHAAIPRRTFYNHFDSKEAVLDSVIEHMMQQCSLEVMFDFGGSLEDLKSSLTRNFRYWMREGRTILEVLMDNGLQGQLVAHAMKWVISEKPSFSRSPGLSAKQIEIITMAAAAGFFSILEYWRNNNYLESPEEIAEYTTWFLAEPLFRR